MILKKPQQARRVASGVAVQLGEHDGVDVQPSMT